MNANISNPFIIMLINMTIVFGVLYLLGWIIRLIQYIDPTKKKESAPVQVAAPAPAPPAAALAAAPAQQEDTTEIAAIIAAAVAAYGYQVRKIVSVRPVGGNSWANAARLEVVNTRNQMV